MKFVRINENFEPRYSVNKLELVGEKHTVEKDGGTFYYQLKKCKDYPELIFVSFGFNGPDQWWSSNSNAINTLFGIDCIECSVREEKGRYPDSLYSSAILKECITLPHNLEWRNSWGFKQILPKKGIEFPRRKDYFMSTHVDQNGNLILP